MKNTAAARRSSDEIQNFVENEDRALFGRLEDEKGATGPRLGKIGLG